MVAGRSNTCGREAVWEAMIKSYQKINSRVDLSAYVHLTILRLSFGRKRPMRARRQCCAWLAGSGKKRTPLISPDMFPGTYDMWHSHQVSTVYFVHQPAVAFPSLIRDDRSTPLACSWRSVTTGSPDSAQNEHSSQDHRSQNPFGRTVNTLPEICSDWAGSTWSLFPVFDIVSS